MKIPLLNDFERYFDDPVWIVAARTLLRRHGIEFTEVRRAEHGENIVVLVDKAFVLKIYTPQKNGFNREKAALEFADNKTSLPIADIVAFGEIEGFEYLITNQLPGGLMTRERWMKLEKPAQVALLTQLAYGLKELHSREADEIHFDWHEFIEIQVASAVDRQREEGGNPEWLESIPKYLDEHLALLPQHPEDAFMHGDVHFGNMRVTDDDSRPVISGLFDFADSLKGFFEYEFVAIGVLMIQGQGDLQREFFRAYGYKDADINIDLRHRLMLLTILYEESSLRRHAERLRPEALGYTLEELERRFGTSYNWVLCIAAKAMQRMKVKYMRDKLQVGGWFLVVITIVLSAALGILIDRTYHDVSVRDVAESDLIATMDREKVLLARHFGDERQFYGFVRESNRIDTKTGFNDIGQTLSVRDKSGSEIFSKRYKEVADFSYPNLTRDSQQLLVETNEGGTDNFLEIYTFRNNRFEPIIDSQETQMRGGYFVIPEYRKGIKSPYFKADEIIVIQQLGGADDDPIATVFRYTENKYEPVGEIRMQQLGDFIEANLSK